LQLIYIATQHISDVEASERHFRQPTENIMRLWKKFLAAYVASASMAGPFVISGYY
jgi:hypothetical protein